MDAKSQSLQLQLARASRSKAHDPAHVDQLRAEFKTVRAEEYIRSLVESAPPLTEAQKARLRALLGGA